MTTVTLSYQADQNIEQTLKALQGYGIMALELIQNADDAHGTTLRWMSARMVIDRYGMMRPSLCAG
ncbi:hypothetical protein EH240_33380 [Mesorhizobium tamadayense]|uniref:Uncharacterized protein n=1 Tax=Mesorhizobium tamadayense TaxID=425306 RepID=A0A3P3EW52_9HYPH|nr:hypothetical protein [Mesorhizobium tamadayense]RRH90102.1 hypothetical protein EH240_33380 [Mesorhizobium tamadayense]